MEQTLSAELVHPFQLAGLGVAPFEFLGAEEKRGTCQYCGRAIATKFFLKSSDGKLSWVGCDCVYKYDTTKLTSEVKREKARLLSQKKMSKRMAEQARANGMLEANREKFALLPHPSYPGKTFADYIEWRLINANTTRTIKLMEGNL